MAGGIGGTVAATSGTAPRYGSTHSHYPMRQFDMIAPAPTAPASTAPFAPSLISGFGITWLAFTHLNLAYAFLAEGGQHPSRERGGRSVLCLVFRRFHACRVSPSFDFSNIALAARRICCISWHF